MIILDYLDTQIISHLRKGSSHASLLARELNEPRTSIAYRLGRLEENKKVLSYTKGRKTMWQIHEERIHNKSLIREFRGQEFLQCYTILETLPPKSTVYAVQGADSVKASLRSVPDTMTKNIHRLFKRREIVLRAIANKKVLENIETMSDSLRKSHTGRPQSIKLLDAKFLSSGEIFVTETFISIINPEKRIGIVIKDKGIVMLLYDMMALLFSLSERIESFDLNAYIGKKVRT